MHKSFTLKIAAAAVVAVCFAVVLPVSLAQNYGQPVSSNSGQAALPQGQLVNGYAMPASGAPVTDYSPPVPLHPAQQFVWPAATAADLIVTTAPSIDGYSVTGYRGLVEGVAVREPTWNQNMSAGFQGMFGGAIKAYGEMCEQGRVQAYQNLMRRARGMGANAVIGVRFDSESLSIDKDHFATAVVCYGTAVVVAPRSGN